MLVNASNNILPSNYRFNCICGKSYGHDSSYYRHKKICSFVENKIIYDDNIESTYIKNINNESSDKELIMLLIKENTEMRNMMMKIIENGTYNTTNNTYAELKRNITKVIQGIQKEKYRNIVKGAYEICK